MSEIDAAQAHADRLRDAGFDFAEEAMANFSIANRTQAWGELPLIDYRELGAGWDILAERCAEAAQEIEDAAYLVERIAKREEFRL